MDLEYKHQRPNPSVSKRHFTLFNSEEKECLDSVIIKEESESNLKRGEGFERKTMSADESIE